MQTRKVLFVIGLTATLVALAWTSVARDTPEQIKAREALRQKMAELDAAAAAAKPAPPAPPVAPTAPATEPALKAPVAPAAPVAPTPVPPPAPVPVPPATTASTTITIFGPVPEGVEDARTAERREALRMQMGTLQPAPAVAHKPVKSGRAPAYTAPAELPPPALEVPLSPLSGPKAARMAELLQRYNADQITPKDYHTQRAAILAEP